MATAAQSLVSVALGGHRAGGAWMLPAAGVVFTLEGVLIGAGGAR